MPSSQAQVTTRLDGLAGFGDKKLARAASQEVLLIQLLLPIFLERKGFENGHEQRDLLSRIPAKQAKRIWTVWTVRNALNLQTSREMEAGAL